MQALNKCRVSATHAPAGLAGIPSLVTFSANLVTDVIHHKNACLKKIASTKKEKANSLSLLYTIQHVEGYSQMHTPGNS